jgi:hypothetical protein
MHFENLFDIFLSLNILIYNKIRFGLCKIKIRERMCHNKARVDI